MKTDIILAGVGGQGILSIAAILGNAALAKDMYVKQAEVHGMSQRGGDVQSNLRLSDSPIASDLIPLGSADIIISLEPMEALRYLPYLKPDGWIVSNSVPVVNVGNYPDTVAVLDELRASAQSVIFDMEAAAREYASPRCSNILLLGAASPLIPLSEDDMKTAISRIFHAKGEKTVELNIKAFEAGRRLSSEMIKAI